MASCFFSVYSSWLAGTNASEFLVCLANSPVQSKIKSVAMDKTESGKTRSELHVVSLRLVILAVPQDEAEKLMLVEDLTWIGCEGLLIHPWSLRNEEMVREFS